MVESKSEAYLDLGAFLSFILFLGHHEMSDLPPNALPVWCFCIAQSLKEERTEIPM